jgi:hypothetical protein
MSEPPAPPPAPPPPDPAAAPPPRAEDQVPAEVASYPVQLDVQHQEEYSRFMPLIKWLILIPHYIVLVILGIGALFAILFSFFAVLFTRKYPEGLFNYVVGVGRWAYRVSAYLFLMTDEYPPFSLDASASDQVTYSIAYPADGVDRWRPLFAWILAIPYLIIANILIYLAEILVFFAFFVILFTKKYPEGMFKIVLITMRWQARGNAYAYWMTTKYPPFAWG